MSEAKRTRASSRLDPLVDAYGSVPEQVGAAWAQTPPGTNPGNVGIASVTPPPARSSMPGASAQEASATIPAGASPVPPKR